MPRRASTPAGSPALMPTDAASARVVKRSLVIAGHRTSVSLEDAFWRRLRRIAASADCRSTGWRRWSTPRAATPICRRRFGCSCSRPSATLDPSRSVEAARRRIGRRQRAFGLVGGIGAARRVGAQFVALAAPARGRERRLRRLSPPRRPALVLPLRPLSAAAFRRPLFRPRFFAAPWRPAAAFFAAASSSAAFSASSCARKSLGRAPSAAPARLRSPRFPAAGDP